MEIDVKKLYQEINEKGKQSILLNQEKVDLNIKNLAKDTRLGLTLLIHLSDEMKQKIRQIQDEIKQIEPNQYIYPTDDLHITVLDILGAKEGQEFDKMYLKQCHALIEKIIQEKKQFNITLKGIIASDAGLLIKGFYENTLEEIRCEIRDAFLKQKLSLEERYKTNSSHITFVRFSEQLTNRNALLAYMNNNIDREIGVLEVSSMEFVIHDWYNIKEEKIGRYELSRK